MDELRLRIVISVISNVPVRVERKTQEWKGVVIEYSCVMTCMIEGKSYSATGKSRDYDWEAYHHAWWNLIYQLNNDGLDFEFSDDDEWGGA